MQRTQGMVLIYVLVLLAGLSALLIGVQVNTQDALKRLQADIALADARYMALSPVNMAAKLLLDDLQSTTVDGAGDDWYRFTRPQTFSIENGSIALQVSDAGQWPNINALTAGTVRDEAYLAFMRRWFRYLGVSEGLLLTAADWIDTNRSSRSGGSGEQSASRDLLPPNAAILSMDEFHVLPEYAPEYFNGLQNGLAVLPAAVPVNVNTMHPAFLQELFPVRNTLAQAISRRERQPFTALGDFYEAAGIDEPTKAVELGMITTYFRVDAEVTQFGQRRRVRALLERRYGKVQLRQLQWMNRTITQ